MLGHVGYLVTPCSSLTSSIAGTELVSATANCGCEAVFGTINDQFSKHVAGYKGNNVVQRGKNVEQAARWSIPDLKDFFAEYAASVYQRRHHDGLVMPGFPDLRLSPNEAHALAVARSGYVACPTDITLREAIRLVTVRGGNPDNQDEVAATLRELQNRIDAPESWTTTDRRRRARDAERARTVARHQHRAAQNAKETSRLAAIPPLKAVPGPEKDGDNEPTSRRFDLGDLTTLPVWSPGNETQEG